MQIKPPLVLNYHTDERGQMQNSSRMGKGKSISRPSPRGRTGGSPCPLRPRVLVLCGAGGVRWGSWEVGAGRVEATEEALLLTYETLEMVTICQALYRSPSVEYIIRYFEQLCKLFTLDFS